MEVFVARQPIFNTKEEVVAYELLYRNSRKNAFPHLDGDEATIDLIINSFLNIGLDELSGGKTCFINFTEELLYMKLPAYFSPNSIVIEILEDVPITPALIDACNDLKKQGYRIALDDFNVNNVPAHLLDQLLKASSIIKIDFLNMSFDSQQEIIRRCSREHLIFLAEKVETREQYQQAKDLGFQLFQGYFFSRPVILSSYDVPGYMDAYFTILKELDKQEPDVSYISDCIEQDLSLSYKLLKMINSPAFRPKNKIHSIKQAIVLLGLNEIKKWIYILSVRSFSNSGRPQMAEVIELSLIRAKLCEFIAEKTSRPNPSEYMLTGMFSLIDTLLHKDMDEVLEELPLAENIKEALKGNENDLLKVFRYAERIEKGDWKIKELGLAEEDVYSFYQKSIQWASSLLREEKDSRQA